jgi:hypothetical protein
VPVHRVFEVHPLLCPAINGFSAGMCRYFAGLWPEQSMLRKGERMLRMLLESRG